MFNEVTLIGNLGRDPEVKTVPGGKTVAQLALATSESFKVNNEWQSKSEWHRVVVWGKMAELIAQRCHKGSKIFIKGRLQTRNWEDKDGQKKYSTEIIAGMVKFLDKKEEQQQQQTQKPLDNFGGTPSFDNEEELPF